MVNENKNQIQTNYSLSVAFTNYRRFPLKNMLPRFTYHTLRNRPISERILKLVECYE